MEMSILLAKIFSLYMVIVGVIMLVRKSYYQKLVPEMVKDKGLLLITAIVTLILGILLVLVHNIWVWNWQVVITILCWLVLLSGVFRLLIPEMADKWAKAMKKSHHFYICTIIFILIGLYLGYMGFYDAASASKTFYFF